MIRIVTLPLFLVACGGCGKDPVTPPDVPIETPDATFDNASCGDQLRFTGEYVDWDTDAAFCGINDALFEEPGGAMDNTAPNGRFDMCISRGPDQVIVDITPAAGNSQCTNPPSNYPIAGIAVANKLVLFATDGGWSGRNFTAARAATIGVVLDPLKAHVFVHIAGPQRQVSIAATHGTTQANATTTWAPGDTGHEVFFPNVELGAGSTTVSVPGVSLGTGSVPLVANKITNVTIVTAN